MRSILFVLTPPTGGAALSAKAVMGVPEREDTNATSSVLRITITAQNLYTATLLKVLFPYSCEAGTNNIEPIELKRPALPTICSRQEVMLSLFQPLSN